MQDGADACFLAELPASLLQWEWSLNCIVQKIIADLFVL